MNQRFMPKIEASFITKMIAFNNLVPETEGYSFGDGFSLPTQSLDIGTVLDVGSYDYGMNVLEVRNLHTVYGVSMAAASTPTITEGSNQARANWVGTWNFEAAFGEDLKVIAETEFDITNCQQTLSHTFDLVGATLSGTVDIVGYTKINNKAGRSYITDLIITDLDMSPGSASVSVSLQDLLSSCSPLLSIGGGTTVDWDVTGDMNEFFDILKPLVQVELQNEVELDLTYGVPAL